MRLAFAGTPPFAVPALNALAGSGHQLAAVFTQPDKPAGRGRGLAMSAVKSRAVELGLCVHQPTSFKSPEVLEQLDELRLDALVVVAFGLLLPPAALRLPALGCFNIHASLLPRWRGAAPIQRAILAGDRVTGITIMRMEQGLDTGPILLARALDIAPTETAASLSARLAPLGGELILEALAALTEGTARELVQPTDGAIYAKKIDKTEALIDWHADAASIERKVRAFNPAPVAETRLRGEQLRIWEASLPETEPAAAADAQEAESAGGAEGAWGGKGAAPGTVLSASRRGLDVACGSGVLRLLRVQSPGRKPVPAAQFAQGRSLAGARLDLS